MAEVLVFQTAIDTIQQWGGRRDPVPFEWIPVLRTLHSLTAALLQDFARHEATADPNACFQWQAPLTDQPARRSNRFTHESVFPSPPMDPADLVNPSPGSCGMRGAGPSTGQDRRNAPSSTPEGVASDAGVSMSHRGRKRRRAPSKVVSPVDVPTLTRREDDEAALALKVRTNLAHFRDISERDLVEQVRNVIVEFPPLLAVDFVDDDTSLARGAWLLGTFLWMNRQFKTHLRVREYSGPDGVAPRKPLCDYKSFAEANLPPESNPNIERLKAGILLGGKLEAVATRLKLLGGAVYSLAGDLARVSRVSQQSLYNIVKTSIENDFTLEQGQYTAALGSVLDALLDKIGHRLWSRERMQEAQRIVDDCVLPEEERNLAEAIESMDVDNGLFSETRADGGGLMEDTDGEL